MKAGVQNENAVETVVTSLQIFRLFFFHATPAWLVSRGTVTNVDNMAGDLPRVTKRLTCSQ